MKRFFYFLIAIAFLTSCRSTRQIQTAINKKDSLITIPPDDSDLRKNDTLHMINYTLFKLDSNQINYRTFSAKVNVDYKGFDGKNYDVNANVRMLKDSIIWINVNAFMGIDAMRLMITQDSVKLLNKLDKVYTARSVSYLQEVTQLPLDLKTVQDLIIGNPVFLDSNIVSYSTGNGITSMLSIGMFFKNLLTLSEPNKGLIRIKLDDADITRSRTADLSYDAYEEKKGYPFSTKRRITVTEKKRLDIKLDFKQYEFNSEVSFPFTVPKNYDRN
jgi:hypothetical protein